MRKLNGMAQVKWRKVATFFLIYLLFSNYVIYFILIYLLKLIYLRIYFILIYLWT